MEKTTVLTKKDLRRAGIRWIQAGISTFNYSTQLAPSVVYAQMHCLRKIYKDDDDYVEALNNHYKYFNCMPWLSALLLGATLAIEDKEGIRSKNTVQDLKVSLMGPLSGIGDTIFWVMIPTIFGSIASYMALQGSPVGLAIWMLLNVFFLAVRIRLFEFGYKQGVRIITEFGRQLTIFTEAASVMGIMVVGSLIPSVVKLETAMTFKNGDITMEIQPLINEVMPSMLAIIATGLIYWGIKVKKIKMTHIILIVLVISMIGAATGIFGA